MALLLLVAAALTVLVTATTIWGTRPVSAQELASARAQVREQVAQPGFQQDLRSCREHPEEFFGPGASAGDCQRSLVPTHGELPGPGAALARPARSRATASPWS